jgi:hypothetical protein
MLSDAEAEYQVNRKSAKDLANTALKSLNQAEGQLNDIQNQIIAITGKACAYKLLGKVGAYNNAASKANELCETILDETAKRALKKALKKFKKHYLAEYYMLFISSAALTVVLQESLVDIKLHFESFLRKEAGNENYEWAKRRGFLYSIVNPFVTT